MDDNFWNICQGFPTFPHLSLALKVSECPGSAESWTEGATCVRPKWGVWVLPRKCLDLNLLKCHFLAPESGIYVFCIHKNILISL
jgi:hypothetical protein